MATKTAPYRHADGSACWTKNCSLGNIDIFTPRKTPVEKERRKNFFADWFTGEEVVPLPPPSPEQVEFEDSLRRVQSADGYYDYVLSTKDKNGFVSLPLVGTQSHLLGVERFLEEGAVLKDVDLVDYQDTEDYSEELKIELRKLLVQRINHGYIGSDMGQDTNYESAQRIASRFMIGVRGVTFETKDGETIHARSRTAVEDRELYS